MADKHNDNPLDPDHLMGHVADSTYFEVPGKGWDLEGKIHIPQIRDVSTPLYEIKTGIEQIDSLLLPIDLRITKFMVLEVLGACLVAVVAIAVAQRIARSDRPRGRFTNMVEAMLVFLRDQVARPAIGKHDADKFLPFLWTLFFFILVSNLLGLVPMLGSATGALAVTAALAFITFCVVTGSGMAKMGVIGFWTGQVPHIDVPKPMLIVLWPLIFAIEVLGMIIKHFVLAVRLLANMLAGHLVLSTIIGFVGVVWGSWMMLAVVPGSLAGALAIYALELFVAFLQAYVFTFLAALFIGMAVHPH